MSAAHGTAAGASAGGARNAETASPSLSELAGRPLPPVQQLAATTLALIVAGGIYLAAHLPRHPPLGPAIGLLALAAVLLVVNALALSRVRDFAWDKFRLVAGWALLAYVVIAGMLEYVFVYDGTRGDTLVVLSLMLVVFALDIPLLLGFSVARFQPAGE
ncbi:MAG TPA: hypothetical protein VMS02_04120 [Solirubrobacteraceae bacterium]|nr:hypothetical protein [Solirubrobacteraceae bacterium]